MTEQNDCGCKAIVNFGKVGQEQNALVLYYTVTSRIYCPLHAAAGDMLAALHNIEARLMSADCDPDDTREQEWHCQLLGYVVDTIAAARGDGASA